MFSSGTPVPHAHSHEWRAIQLSHYRPDIDSWQSQKASPATVLRVTTDAVIVIDGSEPRYRVAIPRLSVARKHQWLRFTGYTAFSSSDQIQLKHGKLRFQVALESEQTASLALNVFSSMNVRTLNRHVDAVSARPGPILSMISSNSAPASASPSQLSCPLTTLIPMAEVPSMDSSLTNALASLPLPKPAHYSNELIPTVITEDIIQYQPTLHREPTVIENLTERNVISHPEQQDQESSFETMAAFQREAAILKQLSDPNFLKILDTASKMLVERMMID